MLLIGEYLSKWPFQSREFRRQDTLISPFTHVRIDVFCNSSSRRLQTLFASNKLVDWESLRESKPHSWSQFRLLCQKQSAKNLSSFFNQSACVAKRKSWQRWEPSDPRCRGCVKHVASSRLRTWYISFQLPNIKTICRTLVKILAKMTISSTLRWSTNKTPEPQVIY